MLNLVNQHDLTLCHQLSITYDHNVNSDQDILRVNTKQFSWKKKSLIDIHDREKVRPEDEV